MTRVGLLVAGAMVVVGIGFLFVAAVGDSSITVTHGDFTLTCPSGTVAEGGTLSCTLANGSAEAKPWPVVAILHLSTDEERALVRGSSIDVTLGTPSPAATIDGGVTWIGDTLVGYSRFDWSGNAGADPTQTTTTSGAPDNSRTVTINASEDTLDENTETFYVALGPDGSKGVGLLHNNKTSVSLTDDDSPSIDKSLSSLELFAGQDLTLSATEASQSKTVAYKVTEATLTAAATHGGATMTMSASFGGSSLDLDGRGGTSIDVVGGQESAAVPLAVGTTTVTLTVTAEDGTTTGTHTVDIVRSELGTASTVSVSVRWFTLTCPAEVAKATVATCTLVATGPFWWPVVAVIHSSADGDSRALVAEDPIIPDTDPAYSMDVALGDQLIAREAANHGYGEMFSGGSRTVYRTYGYQKIDLAGHATLSNHTVNITIDLKDNVANSGGAAEVFYVALAPSGYTGLSQLIDNKVPILLKELPATRSVAAQNIKSTSAEVVVEARNPGGTLYLRYRAGTSGTWTETETDEEVTSSPVQIPISGLSAETTYQVQASFDEDFSIGVRSGSFTTLVAPTVSSASPGDITQTSATITVAVANPDGTSLRLRHQADGATTWTEATPKAASSSPVTFSLASLTAATTYNIEASFDSDFSTKATATFTTTTPPSVSSVSPGSVTETSATVTVAVANPDGTSLRLRHQADGATTWTEASPQAASSSPVTFSLASLTAATTYNVEASFDSDFSTKATATFTTTTPAASVSSVSPGDITETSATVTVAVANPDGTSVRLRHQADGATTWTEASPKAASSSPVTFSLASLTAATTYNVEAAFDSDFSTKATATFTTKSPPSVSSVTSSDVTYQSATATLAVADLDEDTTVYLRYRVGSGSWTRKSAQASSSSSSATFSLDNLSASTKYEMEASFESDFSTGVASASFTTEPPPPPSVSSMDISGITHSSAAVTVQVDFADGSLLYLRHRKYPASGNWRLTSTPSTSKTVFALTGLSADTEYDVEVSFDSDFADRQTDYFQTAVAPPRAPRTPSPSSPPGPSGPPSSGGGAPPPEPPEPPRFADVPDSDTHAAGIEALYAAGITQGCSQQPLRFCPDQPVTRAQMATFLTRALNLTFPETSAGFADVSGSDSHAAGIEALYAAGITQGCSQQPLRFCSDQPVIRAQMATFLTRALNLTFPETSAGFADVSGSDSHAAGIEALYAAGITQGCSQQPLRFCPDQPVTRAQMATFLTRALNLTVPGAGQ